VLDQLDRAGVVLVGYDVLFADPSQDDPLGDLTLEAVATGGAGRFLFSSTRLHPDYDPGSTLRASRAPGAFPLVGDPQDNPKVALLLPYGRSMARFSAIANVTRGEDGVLRDIPLREAVGDWALPSLPLRLATSALPGSSPQLTAAVRPNWRQHSRLPRVSAADLLNGGKPVCRDTGAALPALRNRVALVGYTAAGLNDAKPTPVDPVMPGVEVMAEATEALIAGSAIRSPPAWFKYVLATWLTLLTTFAFYRGEPATDIDSIFVATNLVLLAAAFTGLTFFGFFFDIFASVGFVSLVFGACRLYAGVQRGRAVGNGDFVREFSPDQDRWLAVACLRFVPDVRLGARPIARRRREYRRRLRRFHRPDFLRLLLRHLREHRFRQPRLRRMPPVCGSATWARGRERRFRAGVLAGSGSLAGGRLPALRAGRASRYEADRATTARVPPATTPLSLRRQRLRDDGGRRRAQELVARRAERFDDTGVARGDRGRGARCRDE